MKKYNFGMSIIFIALSIFIMVTSKGYGNKVDGTAMGAGEWPTILAILLLILSVVLIVQTVIELIREKNAKKNDNSTKDGSTEHEETEEKKKVIDFTGKGMIRVYLVIISLALFYALLKIFGFYIASVFVIPAILFIMGERKWWRMLLITAGILLFVFLVFGLLLHLTMPIGFVFK